MGIVLHYAADMFTFVHNIEFSGTMKEHIEYERRLHKVFSCAIGNWYKRMDTAPESSAVTETLSSLHDEYIKQGDNCGHDCIYIRRTSEFMTGYFENLVRRIHPLLWCPGTLGSGFGWSRFPGKSISG